MVAFWGSAAKKKGNAIWVKHSMPMYRVSRVVARELEVVSLG